MLNNVSMQCYGILELKNDITFSQNFNKKSVRIDIITLKPYHENIYGIL